MRLLRLPEEVQKLLAKDNLTMGHAKVLLTLPGSAPAMIVGLARQGVNIGSRCGRPRRWWPT